ncbi:MAG: sensory histidine kinase AtoS [Syntrophaceae bacterium PtaB.Bin038]|nr:MAG: sensory histidine kinase AtoS [Syntrophaceae bacterium PtaB.Bin038]
MVGREGKHRTKPRGAAPERPGTGLSPAAAESRLRAMDDAFDGFIYICSRDYRIEYMNKRLIERTGRDATGEFCYRVLHERDEVCPWCINDRVFAGETVRWEIQSPKDRRWYSIINTPVRNPDGTLSKQALIRDITDTKRTESDLKHALDRLEHEVEVRTAELQMKNRRLLEEIADRKRAEEALAASEERYRSLIDNIGIGISLISPEMRILELNRQMRTWYPAIDAAEKPVCHRVFNDPPREEICSWCPTVLTLRDGQVHESVTETPSGDGVRNFRIVSSPVLDRDGRVTAAIEMVDDVTEHVRAQQAIAESEARYRAIFETTGTATMIVEEDTTISMVNAEFEKQSGFTKAEVEGKRRWTEFVYGDDLEQMLAFHARRRVDPDSVPRSYEIRFRDRSGRVRNVTMTVSMIPGTRKSVASLVDITARKQSEERLKESERFLTDVIDFLPDATFVIDADGRVIAWNRAMEDMTGVPAGEMIGKGDYEYAMPFYGERRPILIDLALKPDSRYEGTYVSTERQGTVLVGEAYMPALKGGQRYFHGTASILRDSSGNVVGAIESIRDITERRRMEEALRKREEELEHKSRNLEEMNTALRVLLKHREEDKSELEERILSNVKKLVVPYLEKLRKSRLSPEQASYVEILDDHLQDILSPFLRNLGTRHLNLTPKEIQVASLIREGKTSKEIADVLGVSARAVDFHRDNIRIKLGIKNKKANLRSFLLSTF